MVESKEEILGKIKELVVEYFKYSETPFVPGKTKIGYSGSNVDEKEGLAVIDAYFESFGKWLAEGKYTEQFQNEFSNYIGVPASMVCNSGSAALYLSFLTLKNRTVKNHLEEGDEVITPALTFPTSLNSIILNNLKPVLVDVDRKTACMSAESVEKMIGPKTKAILILHHLGNCPDMDALLEIAEKHNLFVVEDCCDGHGGTYKGKKFGSFGEMGCFSFYSAHQMTMGEGGLICCKTKQYAAIIDSLKQTGKACFCKWNQPNPDKGACGNRFNFILPSGDKCDHRFVTSNIGGKFKILDIQAAIGVEQLKKLPGFVENRMKYYTRFAKKLNEYSKYVEVIEAQENSSPSWFAVPLAVKETAPFDRTTFQSFMESKRIETRPMLGGNMMKQPAYITLNFRADEMTNTDFFHKNGLFIGCNPALTDEMADYVCEAIDEFFEKL